jgi:regulator of sigma E protease
VDQRDTPERGGDLTPAPTTIGGWLAQNAVMLAIIVAVVAFVCIKLDPASVAIVLVGLGLVIFIHELGHFLAAKWCDVHVETFSIGFGPPLPGCRFRYGETAYQVALVPLGGYVKMVGEGNEEDGEDDPRSFKNKSVGQRMLIISAGVIMNIILAAGCFVGVYMTTGVEHQSAVIGSVDSGSPSWQRGLRPGVEIVKIGTTDQPFFDDVLPEVMTWKPGLPIPITYLQFQDGKSTKKEAEVAPRANEERGQPMIGIAPARSAVLMPPNRKKVPPYVPESAAARATPALENGDRIIGITDQIDAKYDPKFDLPDDPRAPGTGRKDYFELSRRLSRLAGKEVVLFVRHDKAPASATPEAVHVPPAFQTSYGLRLGMGPVTAVRDDSPASKKVVARTGNEPGDTIVAVEVTEKDGTVHRFASDPSPKPATDVTVDVLDPARLPDQLRAWAIRSGDGSKTVTLKVKRKAGHDPLGQDVDLKLPWDDSWNDEQSAPSSEGSPRAIDGLGLAYAITTQIDAVAPDSPAAKAVLSKDGKAPKGTVYPLKKGDIIKTARYFSKGKGPDAKPEQDMEYTLRGDQGAYALYLAEEVGPIAQLGLVVQRGEDETFEVELTGVEDKDRPQVARGIGFGPDLRLEKADSMGQALALGLRGTGRMISQIYQNLAAMVSGRLAFTKHVSGPVGIAKAAYALAGESLPDFIRFLGMISASLAVINFLPIPVLDGGHMAFLIYEKLRGRPAPESVVVAATFVGLAMIGSLLLFVLVLDFKRLL